MLGAHFAAMGARGRGGDVLPALHSLVENVAGNEAALNLLKSGFPGARVSYVEAGQEKTDIGGIAGFSARLLGPTRDLKFLARMDPPADERFLRLDASDDTVSNDNVCTPFPTEWKVPPDTSPYYRALQDDQPYMLDLQAASADPAGLAFALDQAVNNTSIVALLSYGGRKLFFPGDSQFGGWESWLGQPAQAALLGDIDFYKVAHHGSENATPKSGLAAMGEKRFVAMASTQSVPWPTIPDAKLMDALAATAIAVARSDGVVAVAAPASVAEPLPGEFKPGPFWIDHFLPVLRDAAAEAG